jgi:hypothetical protein
MYADEHSEVLPPVAYLNVTNWPVLLDPYLKSVRVHFCPDRPPGQRTPTA